MKIVSLNVNSFKKESVIKMLLKYIKLNDPDIIFLSETKMDEKSIIVLLNKHFSEFNYVINSHSPSRYHGVLMLIKKNIKYEENTEKFECKVRNDNNTKDPGKGRLISIKVGSSLNIVGTYVPNSGSDWKNPLKNLDYRIEEWDKALFSYLKSLKGNTIWIGDVNVCPHDIDVSHPQRLNNKAGFHIRERKSFNNFADGKEWIDIWRKRNPEKKKYTWEGKTTKMRLDNIIISSDLSNKVEKTFILKHLPKVSDHSLIGIVIKE